MPSLKFLVQGSAPQPYEVVFTRSGDRLAASCTCPAGGVGQSCKHRLNLLSGDISALVGGDDPSALMGILSGTNVETAIRACATAEVEAEAAKKILAGRKKALARAMEG